MTEDLNQNLLINLSLITTLHNKNKTVLDMFLPIVKQGIFNLHVKNSNEYCDIITLQNELKSQLGVEISELSLITFLMRLEKEGLIEVYKDRRAYKVLSVQRSTEYLDTIDDKQRDIKHFIAEFIKFSKFENDYNKATRFIFQFLEHYRIYIDDKCNIIKMSDIATEYKSIIEFINIINDNDSQLRNIFIDIYMGYCLCNILVKTPNNKLSENAVAFSDLSIYLDSNFILRLLDLQDDYFTKQTKELFSAMQAEGISLKIFNETVAEIKSVILYRGKMFFDNTLDKNPTAYIAEGITGAISRRHLTRTQLNTIVDTLEQWLNDRNIARENLSSHDVTVSDSDIEELYKFKYQNKLASIDLQEDEYRKKKSETYCKIINVIKKKNEGYKVNLSNYKCLFLTCDNSVYIYNKRATSAMYASFVQNQETMANVLLLVNPQKFQDATISNVIATLKADKQFNLSDFAKWNETCKDFAKRYPDIVEYVKSCIDDSDCFGRIKDIFENNQEDEKQKQEVIDLMYEKINERILKDQQLSRKISDIEDKEIRAESMFADASRLNMNSQVQLEEAQKLNAETEQIKKQLKMEQDDRQSKHLQLCHKKYKESCKNNKAIFWFVSIAISILLVIGTIVLGCLEYKNSVGIGFIILGGVASVIQILISAIPKARKTILSKMNKKSYQRSYGDFIVLYGEDVIKDDDKIHD